jgi:hypothetical protein
MNCLFIEMKLGAGITSVQPDVCLGNSFTHIIYAAIQVVNSLLIYFLLILLVRTADLSAGNRATGPQ